MKKILYIATTADSRNRLDGETIKCRLLKDYLLSLNNVKIYSVDTDNWKKNVIRLIFTIIFYYLKSDDIIVSSADRGANIVLKFFRMINSKKRIYYFVIGGSLSKNINEKKWNPKIYQKLSKIYVEAETLKNDLEKFNITNVDVLNNFRKINRFNNNYKKTEKVKFVYYGRVIKEKGIEEAIKLIKALKEKNIKCSLDIYGQCKEEYLNYLTKLFNEDITYCGEIHPNNKIEYETLSKYDIFIFPTEYPGECLPGALIDCYIAGVAVVASNWKYAKEYIEDGRNGVIFEYKNYNDMLDKTVELINSNKIMAFKKRSKELSKKYDLDVLLSDFKSNLMEK